MERVIYSAKTQADVLDRIASLDLTKKWRVTVEEYSAGSNPQNDLIHKIIRDFGKWQGTAGEEELRILKHDLKVAYAGELTTPMGHKLARFSVSKASKQERSEFIDWLYRFAAEQGCVMHLDHEQDH